MRNTRCNSIIIEGLDSLGKSSQTKRLVGIIRAAGQSVVHVKSPYNDKFTYRLIYWMLGNGWARKIPNVFQFIHFVNKLIFQLFVLPTLLATYDFIVFDRWSISMLAYGVMDGANEKMTRWMLSCISEPDFTVILDGARYSRDRADDSYEADMAYQSRVRSMYLDWALSHDPNRVAVVNANQSIDEVSKDIVVNMQKKGFKL